MNEEIRHEADAGPGIITAGGSATSNSNNNNTLTAGPITAGGTLTPNSRRRAGPATVVADPALLQRMEMLEAKMDTILLRLDIWAGKQQQQQEKKHD